MQVSNLIYVDQPTGTGFSYSSDDDDIRHDEEGVSNDLYDFLQVCFSMYTLYITKGMKSTITVSLVNELSLIKASGDYESQQKKSSHFWNEKMHFIYFDDVVFI